MRPTEPAATAFLLATLGLLLAASVVSSRASQRVGVPVALVFLGLGMAAGAVGLAGTDFGDFALAFRVGTAALVLILFGGGLETPWASVRRVLAPASVLATLGVLLTAGLVAAAARWLGLVWGEALLLGAVVSSTDAASVFAVLRGSGITLKRRVGSTLEAESGINDPLAVMLTTAVTAQLLAPAQPGGTDISRVVGRMSGELALELAIGLAAGVALGYGGRWVLARISLPAGGLYPVLTVALACLAFGLPTLVHGSGFLAVYVTGLVLGAGPLPFRGGLLRVHDALAWLSQVTMFLLLGLLVRPARLGAVAGTGLALALFLAVVARPLATALCLLPFREYTRRDVLYVGWVGLRGAVPIVLATVPVLAGAPGAGRVFELVFFIVVVTALLPGGTVPWVTRKLGLAAAGPPPPRALLEIESRRPLGGELLSFYVTEAVAVAGAAIADLPFPDRASVTLVVRGDELIAPRGDTVLLPGDHVYVFAREEDRMEIQLMFGRPEGE
jgi:cell volume regulation protein A